MIDIFKKIQSFASKRQSDFKKALVISFFRSALGIFQILAVITAINVTVGNADISSGIIKICIYACICIIGNFALGWAEQVYTMKTGYYMIADKRASIGNLIRHFPLGFFNEFSCGKITATLTTTLSGAESAGVMVMIGIISGIFTSLALFVFMLFYDPLTGLITGIGTVVYLLIVKYQMKVSKKNAPAQQKAQTNLTKAVVNFLSGIKVIKSFSVQNGDENLKKAFDESERANIELTKISMPSQLAAGLSTAVFESLILIFALVSHCVFNGADIAKTTVLFIFSFSAFASLNQAGSMLSMIGLLDAGFNEVESIENNPVRVTKKPEGKPTSHKIELKNVSFSYGENEVLSDVSATIEENAQTAIIGPSGSGKTTLCRLIAGFSDVSAGSITLGGVNIRNIREEDSAALISMVFQDVYLFEDSVLNNIRFGKPDATLEEVRAAAKKACCDEFIMKLENGYDTVLKEGGAGLSGGEKQRISIARALIKDAPIVICDEATSALDAENERDIVAALNALTENKTVITIAHRLNTVKNADKILALKDGKIVQEGKHAELINQSGVYRDFIKSREEAEKFELKV